MVLPTRPASIACSSSCIPHHTGRPQATYIFCCFTCMNGPTVDSMGGTSHSTTALQSQKGIVYGAIGHGPAIVATVRRTWQYGVRSWPSITMLLRLLSQQVPAGPAVLLLKRNLGLPLEPRHSPWPRGRLLQNNWRVLTRNGKRDVNVRRFWALCRGSTKIGHAFRHRRPLLLPPSVDRIE